MSSTPTPTPTPTGGGSTPTPGGGTPTPTPTGGTPTPVPTSLVNPVVAASYPIKGANISGSIDDQGLAKPGATTAATSLAIDFNPATGTYKFTRPDGVRNFLQSDLTGVIAQGWLPDRVKYGAFLHNISGGTEEFLVSLMPDTPTHRLNWVGDGLFIRQVWNGSQYAFSGDSFYFGIPTAAGGLPRSGSAEYAIYAQGLLTETGQPAQILKPSSGVLYVDFGAGSIDADGRVRSIYILPGGGGGFEIVYSGRASIASNGFSGTFRLGGTDGSWSGEFFGPGGEEVGAMFGGSAGNIDYVGSIVGSRNADFRGIESDLLSLDNSFAADGILLETSQKIDTATGNILSLGGLVSNSLRTNIVHYTGDAQNWQLLNTFNVFASDKVPGQSNTTYSVFGDVVADANGTEGLTLLNPGSGNPLIQLSYLTYGVWDNGSAGSGSDYWNTRRHVVFGFPSKGDIPFSGNATYSGVIFGAASSTGGSDSRFYDLAGTLNLSVDFGSHSWSGQISANGTDLNSGALRNFGTYGIAPGSTTITSLESTGLTFDGSGTVGSAFGYFFGPQGVEIGGGFSANLADPLRSGYQLDLDGVFVSKRN